jgi:hypothetical protein
MSAHPANWATVLQAYDSVRATTPAGPTRKPAMRLAARSASSTGPKLSDYGRPAFRSSDREDIEPVATWCRNGGTCNSGSPSRHAVLPKPLGVGHVQEQEAKRVPAAATAHPKPSGFGSESPLEHSHADDAPIPRGLRW